MVAPKLRFKEFDGDYLELKYDKFAPLQRGFDLPVSTIVDGDFPVVFSNGILKKHNEFKAKAPGVVTGRSGTIGNITWVEKDYWPHNTSLWVTNFFGNEPKYIFYFLQEFDVSRFASGSGVPTLNRNDVHAQLINIPNNKEEQTKIASFLSAVDEKISQLNQKHELLSHYKQGMMQKLFSQQIRFKGDDSGEFGEWETKCLGDTVTTMQSGLSRQLHDEDIGLVVLRSNNVIDNKVSFDDVKFWYLNDPQGADVNNYLLDDGDILVNFINSMAQIGKSAIYRKTLDRKVICTTNILRIKADQTKVTSEFLNFIFQTNVYQNYIQSITKPAVNQASFTTKEFKMMIFKIPCLEEQTKIANFLSSIDQKIEVVAQQIEQAKTWKKGLLQQMFV